MHPGNHHPDASTSARCCAAGLLFTLAVLSLVVIGSTPAAHGQAFTISQGELYQLELETARLALVGSLGLPSIEAMAARPSGVIYAVSASDDKLYRVELSAANAMEIGPLGVDLNGAVGMTFDAAGGLWLVARGKLFTVDLRTGAASEKASTDENLVALATHQRQLFGVLGEGDREPVYTLVKLDPLSGAVERIATLEGLVFFEGYTFIQALEFDARGQGWILATSRIFISPPENIHQLYRLTDLEGGLIELVSHDTVINVSRGMLTFTLLPDQTVAIPTLQPIAMAFLALLLVTAGIVLSRQKGRLSKAP